MKSFIDFVKTLYKYTKNKLILSIGISVFSSLMSGVGILMLIPLLSFAGIIDGMDNHGTSLWGIRSFFEAMPQALGLTLILILYMGLIICEAILKREITILNSQITQGFARSLRSNLYEKAVRANWMCLMENKKTDLTNMFTIEIARITGGVIYLLNIVSQIIVSLVHISIALYVSFPVTLSVLTCGILFFFYMNSTVRESKVLGSSLHKINQELFSQITEQLYGIKEVKSFGIEDNQINKFEKTNKSLENTIIDFTRLQSKPTFYYKTGAAAIVSICFFCAIVIFKVDAMALLIILYIFSRLWPIFSSFQGNLQNIFVILPSFKKLKDIEQTFNKADEYENRNDSDTSIKPIKIKKHVKFNNVSFKYSNTSSNYILKNLSFEIPALSITAIVGRSGAGKSTTADILIGLLRPTSGSITVDGNEINESNIHSWRKSIGYVPQDAFILNDTIRENLLRFNPTATEDEMWESLEQASAKEFVEKLPQGIDTLLGDKGVKLSGGEKQRIVLARTLLRRPELLVLDEATSSLDNENINKIQEVIESFRGKMTIVIIAHHLSTINMADYVIALDNGEITNPDYYLNRCK